MAKLGLDWWPMDARRPVLRLVAGLAIAPVAIGALSAAIAWLVAGMALPDRAAVNQAAATAALAALSAFVVFSLTFGLLAVLGLWLARRRTALAFALAGLVAGVLFALVSGLILGVPLSLAQPLILGGMGAASLLLVRWISGVRERPADG
ncbi:hypothetical protein P2H44_02705 [Albimonas sp. CAU 1670]|uniref:hypothetical protein n=1 Tax=Albimonas sp. CAU 1670 TaxID=3032599 RepID=UPI0023DA4AB8|nr:hypothetical protein [Albimonas sp. CAU 1670]MDF2231455.1 hypothetical protein [Albimonas sp. CAU 1670]